MRTSLLCLSLFAVHAAVAETPAIAWSAERQLTWDDFVGSVPARADAIRVAATASSLSWSYEFEIEWSRDACNYRILSIGSAAMFHPDRSWVRPGHRNDEVLLHEQGHFDITQIYRQRFAASVRDLVDSERPCRSRSERAASREAEREIGSLVGTVYDDVWRQYRQEQEAYDEDTGHGTRSSEQQAWSRRIEASLRTSRDE